MGGIAPVSGMTMPALNSIRSAEGGSLQSEVGTAMLGKSLQMMDQMNANMVKMMENSVNPSVGGNFDISV